MFAWVIIGWLITGVAWQWYKMGFPLNPALVVVAVLGTIRAAWVFVVTHSVWVVAWMVLVLLSIDVLTPPFLLGPEYLLAVPLSYLISGLGAPIGVAVVIAFLAVFVAAAIIVVVHFAWARKVLKTM